MKGHEPLVAMRMRGRDPALVFIDTEPDRFKAWRDWHAIGGAPSIAIEPHETPARLDLRCIHGLTVSISGDDPLRVLAVVEACMDHRAKRVIANVSRPDHNGERRLERITDTAGHLAWEAEWLKS